MPLTNAFFYLVAVPAVLLTGISKGGFGGSLGMIAVPLMALAVAPMQAAAIMLPLLCFMDLVGFHGYFGKWDTANLKIMLPGAMIGILAGAFGLGRISDGSIRILVGAIAVVFVVIDAINLAVARSPAQCSVPKGVFWSCVSGFTSFLGHAGGPPAMVYLLPQRLEKERFAATINLFFMIVNAVKLVPYALLGQFELPNLATSLALAPLVPVGVRLGIWLQRRVDLGMFYRISQGCLLVMGIQLVCQGLLDSSR